ncbi:MAG TPA: DUF3048 domain-containing protein [Candidatus Saccharimonadales bacterium]|nr:DUF3048 domain-containing protein [Candidatus Saccharimonadales bacterium]
MNDDQPAAKPAKSAVKADDSKETFRTPEEVAAEDSLDTEPAEGSPPADEAPRAPAPPTTSKWKERMRLHWPPGKKEWIVFIIVLLLAAGAAYALFRDHRPATLKPIPAATETTEPSKLSGLPVDPEVNKRTVTGVMIENSPAARPQAGLGEASVVFEAIAEGGITRFLALYQDTAPDNIGPVRSARPYYAQWNLGFDAGYAHVGGSPQAMADIKAWGVRDLDQFFNAGAYHRVSSRPAPHNVFTGIPALSQLEVQKGYVTSTFTGFNRKKKANPDKKQPPAAKTINLNISGAVYNVRYDYNQTANNYSRFVGGTAHTDANTNKQISPVVVIALVMPYGLAGDGYHSNYNTLGSGPVYVFQDGKVITGKWAKADNKSQFTFTDDTGKPIKLNPGITWLTAVAGIDRVTHAP